MQVVVVQTGAANTASVLCSLRRLGADPRLTEQAQDVRNAERVVLPGVGAFASAMARLTANNIAEALVERVEADRPTLAVCLGFQLLFRSSAESPDAVGLSLIDREISAFDDRRVAVPQMGWNRVSPGEGSSLRAGWAYFANSFKANSVPDDWTSATATHGSNFVAAAERGSVLACQFHPELSGAWGQELLGRWLC